LAHWHFFPWSVQYLIGGVIVLSISVYLLRKNQKSWIYQALFFFGLSIALWVFLAFLHRTAPTATLSKQFLRFDLFFISIAHSFLLLMLLFYFKQKRIYVATIAPAFFVGLIVVLLAPFEIVWSGTALGWAYKSEPYFTALCYGVGVPYLILILVVGYTLVRKSYGTARRKFILVLASFVIFYFLGVTVTNMVIQQYPNFPPFGGILTTLEFSCIAYAVSLPVEKITPSKLGKPLEQLVESYVQFLNTFQDKMPGKELGESSFRFEEYREAMGLRDVLALESGKLTFDSDRLTDENISEIPDNILRVMKEHNWTIETVNDFTPVFVGTYETLRLESKDKADEWFEQTLQRHGGFLDKHGILAAMPSGTKLPAIFQELQSSKARLFKEEKNSQAYRKLKGALEYGFEGLCFTKLEPQKVRAMYGVEKAFLVWLTFKEAKTDKIVNPKNLAGLGNIISTEISKNSSKAVVLLDCLDQIVLANSFREAERLLKKIKELCQENGATFLLSIDPEMFEEEQLAAIEKEMREVGG
jgi:hypothetical protein